MSEPADSALTGQEQAAPADSAVDGQEQGDQSSDKRINGLQSVIGKRTSERDAALAEVDALRAQLASYETPEPDGPSQIELMYPERFAADDAGAGEEAVDPMAPPEPPVITMDVHPSRGQFVPLGEAPVIGNQASPSVRYQRDQAEIAAMQRQLNALGQNWVDQARESGLMD